MAKLRSRAAQGATLEQLEEFVREVEGMELAYDIIERAIRAGLIEEPIQETLVVRYPGLGTFEFTGTREEAERNWPGAIITPK